VSSGEQVGNEGADTVTRCRGHQGAMVEPLQPLAKRLLPGWPAREHFE
jgi:hypothetical protein